MACPIHEGDNEGALNLYVQGDTIEAIGNAELMDANSVLKDLL